MTPSNTTKTALSSILSNSNNVWPVCRLSTKKKPDNSRRKWTRGKRMRASRRRPNPSLLLLEADKSTSPVALTNITAEWATFYEVIGTVPSRLSRSSLSQSLLNLSTVRVLLCDPRAVQVVPLIYQIPHGGRSSTNCSRWESRRTRSNRTPILSRTTSSKNKPRRWQMVLFRPYLQ